MIDISNKKLEILFRFLSVFICFCLTVLIGSTLTVRVCKKSFYPIKYQPFVEQYSKEYDLDQMLVYSVINVESGFNKDTVSKKGAVGLMQILPSTAKFIANNLGVKNFDLKDARTNIRLGCYYIKYLQEKYTVRETMLCAYNAGEGKVNEWLKNKNYSLDGKTLNDIPFKETRDYIKKIQKNYKRYSYLYGKTVDN